MFMGIEVIEAPEEEPLTLDEAKAHLRVDIDDDDDLITALISAARGHVESRTGRALVTQAWRLTLDDFPRYANAQRYCHQAPIKLPGGPSSGVTSFTYIDSDGTQQTLDPSAYVVDLSGEGARITPLWNTPWPTIRRQIGGIKIEYGVGYGEPADVPQALKAAMKLIIGELYSNRESWVDSRLTENTTVDNLIFPFVLVYP
jgi:uncharacterized phiE125 gp8 family phage protein